MGDHDFPAIENASAEQLESRIREAARRLSAEPMVDDLETWYLARVVEHCSRAISDVYRTANLDQILRGEAVKPESLEDLQNAISGHPVGPFRRVARAPDKLRGIGDRCLYDVGMAGVRDYHGLSLETLGICSYRMAADVLSILADERELRELFQRNQVRTLPIEEEIAFLRQCAIRFRIYAHLLTSLRGEPPSPGAVLLAGPGRDRAAAGGAGQKPGPAPGPASAVLGAVPAANEVKIDRVRLLARCERTLLLAGTDMERVRRQLRERLAGQSEAVEAVCDDLLLESAAARTGRAPLSYLLAGPAGVGKTHLLRSLAAILESEWRTEVPLLVIEGSRYISSPDVRRLSGDGPDPFEEGRLGEFRRRARGAPLSIFILREADRAHPRLLEIFIPFLTEPQRRRDPSFRGPDPEGTLLAFTVDSNGPSREDFETEEGPQSSPRVDLRGPERAEGRSGAFLIPEIEAASRKIRFSPLSREAMERILDLEIAPVIRRFQSIHDLDIVLTLEARRRFLVLGFSPDQGARSLAEVVRRHASLEITRKVTRDGSRQDKGFEEALRSLREIQQKEIVDLDPSTLEESLLRQARARLPYRRIVIDVSGGDFIYRGES